MPQDRAAALGDPGWARAPTVLANLLVLLVLLVAFVLASTDENLYHRSAQEDGTLEWMTFWSFVIAALVFVWRGARLKSRNGRFPWFPLGIAAFCLFVAMEEISWGQRLLGYRPPEYFLRENFQQELNLHNVFATSFRKFILKALILGYGVVLPLAGLSRQSRRIADRLGIDLPPATLIPAFLATYVLYEAYPWSFSGEWVELMLGLGLLFCGIARLQEEPASGPPGRRWQPVIASFLIAALLGAATAALSRLRPANAQALQLAALTELDTLARDLTFRGRPISRCGIHKRVFSFVEKYDQNQLYRGQFSRLVSQGVPEERVRYFLDPWNSPLWLRHKCSKDEQRQRVFVYSFGPDRRRDSSSWQILGDDLGVVVYERGG